jgi:hypothetical protein
MNHDTPLLKWLVLRRIIENISQGTLIDIFRAVPPRKRQSNCCLDCCSSVVDK